MGLNIVYIPMYYNDLEFTPAGPPFILNRDGTVDVLNEVDHATKTRMVLYRKFENGTPIKKGKEYELFYWKNKWVSLGKQMAEADSIVYNNAPTHALFLVKNADQSGQERIFTYKNGIQIWW
jgi:hypothetical protein